MSSEMNTFQYDGREKRQSELKFLYIINYGCGSKGLGTTEFTKKGQRERTHASPSAPIPTHNFSRGEGHEEIGYLPVDDVSSEDQNSQ